MLGASEKFKLIELLGDFERTKETQIFSQEIKEARELLKNLRDQIKQSAKLLRDTIKGTDEYAMQAVKLKALQDYKK